MKKHLQLISLIMAIFAINQLYSQNLLSGWDNTAGTPYDAGWRVDPSVTVTWGILNSTTGNKFRTNVGSPVNNTTNPLFYFVNADTKFGFQITTTPGRYYQLSGKAWKRNGGTPSSGTFNFYIANNLLANNYVAKNSVNISVSNGTSTFTGLNFVVPSDFNTGYFIWDYHQNSGTFDQGGVWLLNLTDAGDASSVSFNTNGGSSVSTQYFVPSTSYTVVQPSAPTKTDYVFGGWYTDNTYSTPFNFSTAVTTNTVVYAKFTQDPTLTIPETSASFTTTSNTSTIDITGTY